MKKAETALEDIKVHVKIKISALWASMMFCYIYADYFGLYVPGALQRMLEGKMGPLGPTTQGILLGTSLIDVDSKRHDFPVAGVKAQCAMLLLLNLQSKIIANNSVTKIKALTEVR